MKNKAVFISNNAKDKAESLNELMDKGWTMKGTFLHEETSDMHAGIMYILEKEDNSNNTNK